MRCSTPKNVFKTRSLIKSSVVGMGRSSPESHWQERSQPSMMTGIELLSAKSISLRKLKQLGIAKEAQATAKISKDSEPNKVKN